MLKLYHFQCITSKSPPKNHFPFCFEGHYRHYDFIMHYQQTLYHFNSLKVESLFLLLWLVPILLHKYHTTNSQTLIFSQVPRDSTLSFLYNIREIVTNKHSHNSQRHKDSHKAKKPKKKITQAIKHRCTKTHTPQAQILRFWKID